MSAPARIDAHDFTPADFDAVAELALSESGIVLPEAKAPLVFSRLIGLVRRAGCLKISDYVHLLRRDSGHRDAAIDALTTNHTAFNREAHHFHHFARVVRPALLDRAMRGDSVRLWSAGASSGEEVYTLAMTLLGGDPAAATPFLHGDVALLATDINRAVLRQGDAGLYPVDSVDALPRWARAAWIRTEGDMAVVAPEVRALVRFRRLNLLRGWPIKGRFAAILCRNTMIYFDEAAKAALVDRLTDRLELGGYLYIGHSERVPAPALDRLQPLGNTIYRKVAE